MAGRTVLNVDLAKVWANEDGTGFLRTLAWGDAVEVVRVTKDFVEVKTTRFDPQPDGSIRPVAASGFIRPGKGKSKPKPKDVVADEDALLAAGRGVLKLNFVDVQQGDAAVLESPAGKVVLIDGGDNQLFARYLANRFRGTSPENPRTIDAIVVTHGDADHFAGLPEIRESEENPRAWKRLWIHPERVYHNGLVKRPGTVNRKDVPEAQLLGKTAKVGDDLIITELHDDFLDLPNERLNTPFRAWRDALREYRKRAAAAAPPRSPILVRRLEAGTDDAFDFLAAEGVNVEVLGPIPTQRDGVRGLRFLGEPPAGPRIGHDPATAAKRRFAGNSASHTINGHSIVLRVTYGGFRFLLAGDLNEEAEGTLTAEHPDRLRAEVFKVPHHGSADFSAEFLRAVCPLVSVISSGDENAQKEYIHPRACLVGALGRHARTDEPLVLVTELVAFFETVGWVAPEKHALDAAGKAVVKDGAAVEAPRARREFFAFKRTAFGIVKTRTDGRRLLVYTNSGQADLKEAYAYTLDASGEPVPAAVVQA
jgi:beta-lactamase superfamily II metal-dependent hydrolase